MGNSCVFSCWNNRIAVVDENLKKFDLVKTDKFDIDKYNPMILGNGISGKAFKLNMNNHKITCKKVKKNHFKT